VPKHHKTKTKTNKYTKNLENTKKTLHCISKPYVLSDLSTLSQGTSSKEKANEIRIVSRSSHRSHLSSICRTLIPPTEKLSKKQDSITHTIYQHCFLCSFCSALTMKPESNLQITTNSNHFPTYLKCYQIICSYQLQHRTSK
jgi:hypothetical protein